MHKRIITKSVKYIMLISPSGRGGTSRWHSDVLTSITPIDVHHFVDLDFFGGGGPEGSPEEEGRSCFTRAMADSCDGSSLFK